MWFLPPSKTFIFWKIQKINSCLDIFMKQQFTTGKTVLLDAKKVVVDIGKQTVNKYFNTGPLSWRSFWKEILL